MGKPLAIKDFMWGLNLTQDTVIDDNQFTILKNFYYNSSKQLETRRWYRKFWPSIWTSPITSYNFFQRDDSLRDDTLATQAAFSYSFSQSNNSSAPLMFTLLFSWSIVNAITLSK